MEQELVSVILCLYNVAPYLEKKRLSCIFNQTYHNLDIILVNDGSTDNTSELCSQLAAIDSRVKIVEQSNGGLGSARNAGLGKATGEYVWFYDVDDEVELNLVERNVRWMRDKKVDMTVFGMWFVDVERNSVDTSHFKERLVENNSHLKQIFMDELFLVPNGNGFVWNKFYRRSFLTNNNARFGLQRIQQDEPFNLRLYPHVNRMYISSELFYHYYLYNTGNNRSHYIKNRIQIYESIFDSMRIFAKEWNLEDNRFVDNMYQRLYTGISNCILYNAFHHEANTSFREKREEIINILNRKKVIECLKYIESFAKQSLEGRLYYHAFVNRSFWQILLWRNLFVFLRHVKSTI